MRPLRYLVGWKRRARRPRVSGWSALPLHTRQALLPQIRRHTAGLRRARMFNRPLGPGIAVPEGRPPGRGQALVRAGEYTIIPQTESDVDASGGRKGVKNARGEELKDTLRRPARGSGRGWAGHAPPGLQRPGRARKTLGGSDRESGPRRRTSSGGSPTPEDARLDRRAAGRVFRGGAVGGSCTAADVLCRPSLSG